MWRGMVVLSMACSALGTAAATASAQEAHAGVGYAHIFRAGGFSFVTGYLQYLGAPASTVRHRLGGDFWYANTDVASQRAWQRQPQPDRARCPIRAGAHPVLRPGASADGLVGTGAAQLDPSHAVRGTPSRFRSAPVRTNPALRAGGGRSIRLGLGMGHRLGGGCASGAELAVGGSGYRHGPLSGRLRGEHDEWGLRAAPRPQLPLRVVTQRGHGGAASTDARVIYCRRIDGFG